MYSKIYLYLRPSQLRLLPLLDGVQQVLVLQLRHVRVQVEMPLLCLAEQLLQQQDVGVAGVEQLSLHLAAHCLLDCLDDLLHLVHGEGVIVDPHLLGVIHCSLDTLETLSSLVLGELAVGQQLRGMVVIHISITTLQLND